MNFAERLKELRLKYDLTQLDLAIETGYSQSIISAWEKNKFQPNALALIILSRFFGESVDYLLGLID